MTTENQTVNKHQVLEPQQKMETQSQKYVEIINSLSDDALEIIAVSLWPNEIKILLLHAPLSLQEIVIEGALSDVEVINSLSEEAVESIGGLILAEEMKEMLLCAPLTSQKQIIDDHLKEQNRINNLQ